MNAGTEFRAVELPNPKDLRMAQIKRAATGLLVLVGIWWTLAGRRRDEV